MHTPESLRALLTSLIDYAGLYPPASLDLDRVVENYERYLASQEAWILNRLVLPASELDRVSPRSHWRITLLAGDEKWALPDCVETIESKSLRAFPIPVYRELPLGEIEDGFAKVRTGALVPEGIPTAADLADFLMTCAGRKLPFKATAGLHHPIRSDRPLTYAPESPRGVMHGFINFFSASAFAWHGAREHVVLDVLHETDPQSFRFDDANLYWRDHWMSTEQINRARRDFAHSFGSCSFEEPIEDLRQLGWLTD